MDLCECMCLNAVVTDMDDINSRLKCRNEGGLTTSEPPSDWVYYSFPIMCRLELWKSVKLSLKVELFFFPTESTFINLSHGGLSREFSDLITSSASSCMTNFPETGYKAAPSHLCARKINVSERSFKNKTQFFEHQSGFLTLEISKLRKSTKSPIQR